MLLRFIKLFEKAVFGTIIWWSVSEGYTPFFLDIVGSKHKVLEMLSP